LEGAASVLREFVREFYLIKPKIAMLFVVPTITRPSAMVGVMYLLNPPAAAASVLR
jgi:hypothetical protein